MLIQIYVGQPCYYSESELHDARTIVTESLQNMFGGYTLIPSVLGGYEDKDGPCQDKTDIYEVVSGELSNFAVAMLAQTIKMAYRQDSILISYITAGHEEV